MKGDDRRPGRPREFDEGVVVARAVDLFWSAGAASTTTRRLEAELGVTQSSIYNAFGSKQGLLDAALDRYEQDFERTVFASLEASPGDPGAVERFVDQLLDWVSDASHPGCLLVNVITETAHADPAITERALRHRRRIRAGLASALSVRGVSPADVAVRADVLLAGALGLSVAARAGAEPHELLGMAGALRSLVASWR